MCNGLSELFCKKRYAEQKIKIGTAKLLQFQRIETNLSLGKKAVA